MERAKMNQITVDPSTGLQLRAAVDVVRIYDRDGQFLGYFTPAVARSLYQTVQPPSSEQELLRRAQAGGGRTLAEIMADLEKRS